MVANQLQHRRKLYFDLSSRIALLDNARLQTLFEESDTLASWGKNQVITLGRSKVFVKRIPVTDIEYDNMFSTKNLYDIPTFYNYGFGSAGLGVFRELVTHIKTTNWVLSGEIATFPLMYHYRLIPFAGVHDDVDMESHARYVKYWGSNANIGRYMLDRAQARYELVLFLEKFPYTVADWILDNPAKLPLIIADTRSSLAFMRKNGILHLDAHFYNMVTDGNHVYLTDFGLALDKHFDLSPAERGFYKQHSDYDFGYLLWAIGFPLFSMYGKLSEPAKARLSEDYGIKEGAASEEMVSLLLGNLEEIASRGILPLHRDYAATLARYRSVGDFMRDFYLKMRKNDAKDTPFDHKRLRRLLTDVGFDSDSISVG